MNANAYWELLAGSSGRTAKRGVLLAVGVAVSVHLGLIGLSSITGTVSGDTSVVVVLSLIALSLASAFSYANDGLALSVLLATAPFLGWVTYSFAVVEQYPPAPDGTALAVVSVVNSSIFGIPLGILGFVLGLGAKRFRSVESRVS